MPHPPLPTHYWQTLFDLLPVAVVFVVEKAVVQEASAKVNPLQPSRSVGKQFFANQSAYELLALDIDLSLKKQLENLYFSCENKVTESRQKASPLLLGLAGEAISQRDILFDKQPLSIESKQYYGDDYRIYAVTLQPRDHRLFLNTDTPMDLSNAEITIKDLVHFEKMHAELTHILVHSTPTSVDSDIQYALTQLGYFCHADRTYIFLFDFEHTAMSNTHEWVRSGISSHIDDLQNVPHSSLPWFFQQIRDFGVVNVANTARLGPEAMVEQAEFAREDIQSILCVGFYHKRELIGFIGMDMVARQRRWSEADVRRVRVIGELIATAVNNERLLTSLHTSQQQLRSNNDALRELVLRDGITGLANQRQFHQRLHEETSRAHRQQHELCIAIFTIPRYCSYQKLLGNEAANSLLIRISGLIKQHFRRHGEIAARLQGEQFAVIIPHIDVATAISRSLELVQLVFREQINHPNDGIIALGYGVAGLCECNDAQQLVSLATNRLTGALTDSPYPSINNTKREAL